MKNMISMIADICGILGFIISLIVAKSVYSIRSEMRSNNKVKISGKTQIRGDFVGRDKI